VASSPTDVKRKRASIIARIASEVTRREWRELATADAQVCGSQLLTSSFNIHSTFIQHSFKAQVSGSLPPSLPAPSAW
jgi:hypothetical protein